MTSNLIRFVSVVVLNAAVALWIGPARAGEIFVPQDDAVFNDYNTISAYSTPSGAPINTSLVTGSGMGLIGASGNDLFVANSSFGNPTTVSEYTTSGALVNASLITPTLSSDTEYFLTSDGNLWGEGFSSQRPYGYSLLEWNTSGTLINTIPLPGTTSNGETTFSTPDVFAVSGSDIFLSFGGTTLSEWTTTGTVVNASLITGLPSGSIAASGSDIFVSNTTPGSHPDGTDYISEYSTSGTLLNPALVTGLTDPGQIAVSGGNLFVASTVPVVGFTEVIGEYTLAGAPVNASLITGPEFGSGELGPFVVTPEPASWVLAVIGLIGLLTLGRRR